MEDLLLNGIERKLLEGCALEQRDGKEEGLVAFRIAP